MPHLPGDNNLMNFTNPSKGTANHHAKIPVIPCSRGTIAKAGTSAILGNVTTLLPYQPRQWSHVKQVSFFIHHYELGLLGAVSIKRCHPTSKGFPIIKIRQSHSHHIDGIVQERRNSSALAKELHLPCINSSIYGNTLSLERQSLYWNKAM